MGGPIALLVVLMSLCAAFVANAVGIAYSFCESNDNQGSKTMLPEMPTIPHADSSLPGGLELGAFSLSLNVADLEVSRAFYERLGFVVTGGGAEHNYLIMKNAETTIGLFHGMFEGNILTFNPGLTNRMERIENFLDVREIEKKISDAGVDLVSGVSAEAGDKGPANITLIDPDGNAILIDQFF